MQQGRANFGDSGFRELCRDIEDVHLKADFLVHGYDPNGYPHIFTVEHPTLTKEYGRIGFWAIGSGQHSALSILFFHKYNARMPFHEAVYHICEAKFMAESALGVGKDTVLGVLRSDGTGCILRGDELKPIRQLWERKGQPRLPKGLHEVVSQNVESHIKTIAPF